MEQRNFEAGAFVNCPTLRKTGQIIEGPNRRGEYLVGVGTVSLWMANDQLEPASSSFAERRARSERLLAGLDDDSAKPVTVTVDLHGQTAGEAREALELTIDRALLTGASRIEIIHGLGAGILQKTVHEYLSRMKQISSFKLDDRNPGITWAFL